MTWPKVVYALRCSFWNFRPGEPELLRVLGDMGWSAPCSHVTGAAIPGIRETRWERLRGGKGYPLESMPGEGDNDRMNFLWLIQKHALEQH